MDERMYDSIEDADNGNAAHGIAFIAIVAVELTASVAEALAAHVYNRILMAEAARDLARLRFAAVFAMTGRSSAGGAGRRGTVCERPRAPGMSGRGDRTRLGLAAYRAGSGFRAVLIAGRRLRYGPCAEAVRDIRRRNGFFLLHCADRTNARLRSVFFAGGGLGDLPIAPQMVSADRGNFSGLLMARVIRANAHFRSCSLTGRRSLNRPCAPGMRIRIYRACLCLTAELRSAD